MIGKNLGFFIKRRKNWGVFLVAILLIILSVASFYYVYGGLQEIGFIFNNILIGIVIAIAAVYHMTYIFKLLRFLPFLKKAIFDIVVVVLGLLPLLIETGVLSSLSFNLVLDIPLWALGVLGLIYGVYIVADFFKKQYVQSPKII
ncbi:MAG: hypothetical protein PHE43_02990 [Candidatus Nanoarchaeia archaeon]|nr:hypothetical protein [Candidatus Nanoarchaeia archaeon]